MRANAASWARRLARLHLAGADYKLTRPNALSIEGWKTLVRAMRARRRTACTWGSPTLIDQELRWLEQHWPRGLPEGVIHADLFPDNVFFMEGRLSGMFDFYFACNDALAYDIAVCLNAWCFEGDGAFNITKGRALLTTYRAIRPLQPVEVAALPILARGAAFRFLLTRLYDWIHRDEGALVKVKDPARISDEAALSSIGRGGRVLRVAGMNHVEIYTDGACSGNPGPGGWGAILVFKTERRELSGGETLTTNNRMELMAAIAALEALKRACDVHLYTDSMYLEGRHHEVDRGLEEKRLEDRRQEAGQEHRSVAAPGRRARAPQDLLALGARA